MNRKSLFLIAVLVLVGISCPVFQVKRAETLNGYPVHNLDTGLSYASIQEAVNANATLDGHTITVDAGVYYENVVVNKSLSLIGKNRDSTIIDANGTGNSITIEANYSRIENFTIQNSGFGVAIIGSVKRLVGNVVVNNFFRNDADAIGLSRCDKNVIVNNTFENNGFNIVIGWINPFAWGNMTSNSNVVVRNNMTKGVEGILIIDSRNNIVSENNISNMTDKGIASSHQAQPPYYAPIVTNNSLCNNVIVNCTFGLETTGVGYLSNITGNIIRNNQLGLHIYGWGNNTIVNNTVANNVFGLDCLMSQNINLLRDNKMLGNMYSFLGSGANVNTSNTVDGKYVYFLSNQSNLNINPVTYPKMGCLFMSECNNITVEDMNFSHNGFGISVSDCANVTIQNTTLQDNFIAMDTGYGLADSTIRGCIVQNNLYGLQIFGLDRSDISGNLIANNSIRRLSDQVTPYFLQLMPDYYRDFESGVYVSAGIRIHGMSNSTVIGNSIIGNERGIYLSTSSYNVFRNNTIAGNVENFGRWESFFPYDWALPGHQPNPPQISPYLMNDVDTSNTVDGKPIYWWINQHDEQVPTDAGYIVLVNSTNMIVKNVVLQNNTQGMLLIGVSNSLISNNVITNTQEAVYILDHVYVNPSTGNTFTQNNMTRNGLGIRVRSPNNIISHNLFTNNLFGISVHPGADNVTITGNRILNCTNPPLDEWILGRYPVHSAFQEWAFFGNTGLILDGSNASVYDNLIQNNDYGISVGYLYNLGGDKIYHNNFINNTEQVWQGLPGRPPKPMPNNTWDDGYPSGGNYWSDYNGTDLFIGLDQNDTGNDAIGDTPYTLDANNVDRYPLTGMFSDFEAASEYHVQTICNSTISNFQFNGTAISFDVTGANGTAGFCRICIPTALMNDSYRVFVNGTEVSSNLLPCSNNTHSYLYFNYTHSKQEVIIIPEYSSFLILPLFMIATLLAVIIHRRRIGIG